MKKIILIFIMGILIAASLTSCTQNDDIDEFLTEQQACCGEGETDPPPPPPPPTGEGG